MDQELVCNLPKCRKRITGRAWVTSCSRGCCLTQEGSKNLWIHSTDCHCYLRFPFHDAFLLADIFCGDDGEREVSKLLVCPCCESSLTGMYDVMRTDVSPSEPYKSMILAGQRPENIMEIASRALSFWTYQQHQELRYLESAVGKAKELAIKMQQQYDHTVAAFNNELAALKAQLSATDAELQTEKARTHELSERLSEKARQHQKLQSLYDSLRRRSIGHSAAPSRVCMQGSQGEDGMGARSPFNGPSTDPTVENIPPHMRHAQGMGGPRYGPAHMDVPVGAEGAPQRRAPMAPTDIYNRPFVRADGRRGGDMHDMREMHPQEHENPADDFQLQPNLRPTNAR